MKKEKAKKEVILPDSVVRLLEFVEKHGGPTKVAKTMGTTPQIFYNYRNGLSKPGTDVYVDLRKSYPDFDANWVLFGEDSTKAFSARYESQIEELRAEVNDRKRRENIWLSTIEKMEGKKGKGVTNSPKLYDLEGSSELLKSESLPLSWLPVHDN